MVRGVPFGADRSLPLAAFEAQAHSEVVRRHTTCICLSRVLMKVGGGTSPPGLLFEWIGEASSGRVDFVQGARFGVPHRPQEGSPVDRAVVPLPPISAAHGVEEVRPGVTESRIE